MNGLIINPHWADLILSGEKIWEIRGRSTNIRGTIGIIKSGSKKVFGTVDLVDCIPLYDLGRDDVDVLLETRDKHHVPLGGVPYLKPWAWVLENARKLPEPVPYDHPQGAIIWVNIGSPSLLSGEEP